MRPSAHLRNLSALLAQVESQPFVGVVYRFIGSRFVRSPLSGAGSRLYGGRFNPPDAFEVLYTALDADTALAEREGILLTAAGIKVAQGIRTGVFLRLSCRLTHVLDLTDERVRAQLDVPMASLLGPWLPWNAPLRDATSPPAVAQAPSQRLGIAVHEGHSFEAILSPSAKDANGRCLAILPDRLRLGSSIAVDDPDGIIRGALGIGPRRAGH